MTRFLCFASLIWGIGLVALASEGCSPKAAPTAAATKPSLESTNPQDRIDAARDAANKFGGKP
jgi:hypothetical protein